jgi:XTP/dITP diphosphohydrolase
MKFLSEKYPLREIIVASTNAGKIKEFREILGDLPLRLSSLFDNFSPLPSIPETGSTFLENALLKARWVCERKQKWVLADDSGLEVDALDGAPGVRSARFAGESAGSEANNRKLLEQLAEREGVPRTARFRCVIVLCTSAENYFTAEGVCEGAIAHVPQGGGGFGYDPLFVPEGFTRTFAELESAEKHAISHRGKALAALRERLHEFLG